MILKHLALHNFGLYGDYVEFDLCPKKQAQGNRPIVLIGGKNGAGKTTFLEAIRFALYGKRALGLTIAQKDYEEYLRSKINHSCLESTARVTLNFEYVESGVSHDYKITRSWRVISTKALEEEIELTKDGDIVKTVPKEEWSSFLLELIPIGVSQLFFFDGEKIQDIAEDNDAALSDAIKSLLGIDLVERLKFDLSAYLTRNKGGAKNNKANSIPKISKMIAQTKEQERQIFNEVNQIKFNHEALLKEVEQKRLRFIAEGGDAALNYDQLKVKYQNINKKLSSARQELTLLSNDLLPFLMAPNLVQSFKKQLALSLKDQDTRTSISDFKSKIEEFKVVDFTKKAQWKEAHWDDLLNFIHSQANTFTPSKHVAFNELVDPCATLGLLDKLDQDVRYKAKQLYEKFISLNHEKEELEHALARAENSEANSFLDELLANERKVGVLDSTLNAKEEELKKVRWQLLTLERELNIGIENQLFVEQQGYRNSLAAKSTKVLLEFEKRLLTQKIDQVRKSFIEIFNSLLRKSTFIVDIEIDPIKFTTVLIDSRGKKISKQLLSAGEKQIYAIAMLWALAKTSGRVLPMIIDTPLGRLDSEHRKNLVQYYFPYASHQVIILSTDTEVRTEYLKLLNDSISHGYRLDYDAEKGQTSVNLGYFELEDNLLKEKKIALQQA